MLYRKHNINTTVTDSVKERMGFIEIILSQLQKYIIRFVTLRCFYIKISRGPHLFVLSLYINMYAFAMKQSFDFCFTQRRLSVQGEHMKVSVDKNRNTSYLSSGIVEKSMTQMNYKIIQNFYILFLVENSPANINCLIVCPHFTDCYTNNVKTKEINFCKT